MLERSYQIRRLTEAQGWLKIIIKIRNNREKYNTFTLCIVINTIRFKEAAKKYLHAYFDVIFQMLLTIISYIKCVCKMC